MTTKENLKKKAAAAEKRPAKYGEDIDLETSKA
jgi:hypothetical protein